jgi:hypothetical protein
VAQDRGQHRLLVNTVMNSGAYEVEDFLTNQVIISFSRTVLQGDSSLGKMDDPVCLQF